MDDIIKRKLEAAAKIGLGAARMASGIATASGHGFVGATLRNHHMTYLAGRLAKSSLEGGMKMVDEGLADWKRAKA